MARNAIDEGTKKALQLKVGGLLRCINKMHNAESLLCASHSIKIEELRSKALEARTSDRLDHSRKILTENFKDLLHYVLDVFGISNVALKIPQSDLDFETLEFFASWIECDPNAATAAGGSVASGSSAASSAFSAAAAAPTSSVAQTSSVIAPAITPNAEAGADSLATWFKARMEKLNTVVDLAVLICGMSALIFGIEHFSRKDIGAFTDKLS